MHKIICDHTIGILLQSCSEYACSRGSACSYFWNHKTAPINGGEVLLYLFIFIFMLMFNFMFIYQRNRIICM